MERPEGGWVKIYRKTIHSPIFDNPYLLKFWIWCLLKADAKKHEAVIGTKVITIKPGQFIFGRNSAAAELNVAPITAYKYLNLLESMGMISTERNNKFTLVTILKWGFYQADSKNRNNKVDSNLYNKVDSNLYTHKKDKKDKERKEIEPEAESDDDGEWLDAGEALEKEQGVQ